MTTNLLGRVSGFESTVTTQRLGGRDGYETESLLSAASFAPGVDVAYVATGLNFPDALAASAASPGRGPVLLVETNAIPQVVQDELIRLAPGRVVVASSAAVVSDAVLTQLRTLTGADVVRKSGSDRYATAAEISEDAFSAGGTRRVRGDRPELSRRPGGRRRRCPAGRARLADPDLSPERGDTCRAQAAHTPADRGRRLHGRCVHVRCTGAGADRPYRPARGQWYETSREVLATWSQPAGASWSPSPPGPTIPTRWPPDRS